MKITTTLTLDFARNTSPPVIYAKQDDSKSRFLKITLTENGMPYTLESGVTACIRALKPDNTAIFNNATINSNVITAELTEQMLTAPGFVIAEISLYKNSTLLSTQYFYLNVERSALSERQIVSSNEYGVLIDALNEASQAVQIATDAVARLDNIFTKTTEVVINTDTKRVNVTINSNTPKHIASAVMTLRIMNNDVSSIDDVVIPKVRLHSVRCRGDLYAVLESDEIIPKGTYYIDWIGI